jgi:hypothetical protein
MSLCRRPYIDNIKEFSQGEKDRLTVIDNEIWEKAKESKLFVKVIPKKVSPAYQIKNSANISSVYNFINEINKKHGKKIVKLAKRLGFSKEVLSINVIPLNRETQGSLFNQDVEQKNDLKDLGLEKRLFSESRDTTSLEILNKIANSDHNLASLAAHLIPYTKYVNAKISLVENIKPSSIAKNPNGSYNHTTGDILIKRTAGFTTSRAEATILHEIIHSLTYYELRKDTEENAYFTELFNHAELYLGTLNLYGLSNKDEFMTALFTDADFVKQLQNVPPLNKKIYKNLFEEVFDKILKLLRITKSSPFYEEAFSTATNIIENFRQSAIEQENYEEYLKSNAYEESLYPKQESNIKPTQTVESYRAQEQAELSQRIPNIENYKVNGKVDKSLITDENDLKIYNEIYDKYDALITPLLEVSAESTDIIKNKIAINKLFKSLPILNTIGTQEQYLRHFNSIYSDTSVPIVVYRAVKHEGSELKDKSFFTDDPEYAIKYGDILKPYKLNILNPYTSTKIGIHRANINSMLEDPTIDGIIGKESFNNVSMGAIAIELQEAQAEGRYLSIEGAVKRLAGPLTDTNSFVTTNVNQVYELGTKIDVDNFKEFVRNDLGTKELNKKSVSLYSKIFDVSEDEINEHLKNCG